MLPRRVGKKQFQKGQRLHQRMLGSFIKHLVPKWNIEYTIKTKGLGHLHLLEVEIEERIEWSILFIFFFFQCQDFYPGHHSWLTIFTFQNLFYSLTFKKECCEFVIFADTRSDVGRFLI